MSHEWSHFRTTASSTARTKGGFTALMSGTCCFLLTPQKTKNIIKPPSLSQKGSPNMLHILNNNSFSLLAISPIKPHLKKMYQCKDMSKYFLKLSLISDRPTAKIDFLLISRFGLKYCNCMTFVKIGFLGPKWRNKVKFVHLQKSSEQETIIQAKCRPSR